MFGLSTTKIFDKLLERATSGLQLEPDYDAILQICDIVKSQEVTPKYAVQSIKKRFGNNNSHIVLSSLYCLESIVKNCGGLVHKEVAQKHMMDALRELAKNRADEIREKVLTLIQCWSHGLGQHHKIFTDTYNLMKLENYSFPPLEQGEATFENSDIAPEWRDDKQCFRCQHVFTMFNRKHHCRACGNIFCDKCSSKQCPIPKFGIDIPTRVCDNCYETITSGIMSSSNSIAQRPRPTTQFNTAPSRSAKSQAEMEEEEALQLALAISQSEAEDKERQKKILTQKYAMSSFLAPSNVPENDQPHSELNRYIERGRQEQQQEKHNPSNISNGHETMIYTQLPDEMNEFVTDEEIDEFITLVNDHINNFKFRMLSNQQRNRNITNDTAVQSVFVMLQHLHPELHRFMQLLEEKRAYFENLQDKLSQLKDAREALNALRAEHNEKKQQEALERDRQRQIQLAQKLDFMRQKKQEYLDYQRQLHLQRLAHQELEMKTRLEQQRQLALAREQLVQNPQLSMISYDYNRTLQQNPIYQTPTSLMPVQQQQEQPLPLSQYTPTIMYPSTQVTTNTLPNMSIPVQMPPTIYQMPVTGESNHVYPVGQVPLINTNLSIAQQPMAAPAVREEVADPPPLITFD